MLVSEDEMQSIYTCLGEANDYRILLLSVVICTVGVYASFAISKHAGRSEGRARRVWAAISVVASGCTAWATHMVALLAFRPGMNSGFDPALTALSLGLAILGIGLSVAMAVGRRGRRRRFLAGLVLGLGVTTLHYVGQAAYVVTGGIVWNRGIVAASVAVGLAMFGAAMIAAGERNRTVRRFAAPLLLSSIAVVHLGGMTAMRLTFDPARRLPDSTVAADVMAPVVAAICLGLLALAFLGLRFTLDARARLRRDQERLRELANLALEGLAICNGDVIATTNDSLERLSGLGKAALAGRRLSSLLPGVALSELPEREERDAELLGAEGQLVPVRVLRSEVRLGDKPQTVVAVRDQSERLRTESTMRTLAFSDPLTGLPNRTRFNDLLAVHAASCRDQNRRFAVMLLDLDRFKSINDTLGHGMGDELLRRVGGRLRRAARDGDLVARLGGDEFAMVVEVADESGVVRAVAENVVDLLGRPFMIGGHVLEIATSVGIALAPEDGTEPSELSRNADLALYRAKHEGGGAYRFFETDMNTLAQARRLLELDLRRATAREEFEVHYQPQVDPKTGRFEGAEALARWNHPQRGMVSPADFIPLAEEIGLIGTIGEWVLRTACLEAMTWPGHLTVAVNLSPVQLRDRQLAQAVAAILAETGLPGSRLELEITEGALMQDEVNTYANLHALRALGIRISMDDFGTGYSSLSYLRRFPFDKIKIDQSFIRQVPDDVDSVAIVQAIASLGAKLRMTVTVEGVETREQQSFVVAEGCDQIQGYLISRPVPASRIKELFTTPLEDRAVA
jgi:diguanylate cyclase